MQITIQKIENNYLLKCLTAGKYLVNNKEYNLEYGKEYLFAEEPKLINYVTKESILAKYSNGHHDMTIESYKKQLDAIPKEYDSYDESLVFKTLDDEYKYKMFVRDWKPVFVEHTKYTEVVIQIVNLIRSDNDFITPMWTLGEIENPLCKYWFQPDKMFKQIANELGFTESLTDKPGELEYHIPKHSTLDYIKINNNFVFGTGKGPTAFTRIGTYSDCLELYTKNYNHIKNILLLELDRIKLSKVEVKASDFLDDLINIKKRVETLDIKAKDYSTKKGLETTIDSVIEKLRKTIK